MASKGFCEVSALSQEQPRTVTGHLALKSDQRLPISGSELVREYKGQRIIVTVFDDGIFCEDQY